MITFTRALFAAAFASLTLASSVHAQTLYTYDDGAGNLTQAPTFAGDICWGNVFSPVPGGEVITDIRVVFGSSAAGLPVRVYLVECTNPGDPSSGTLLAQATGVADARNVEVTFALPPARVKGDFFVGVAMPISAPGTAGRPSPAYVDTSTSARANATKSYLFGADTINPANLGASPFVLRLSQFTPALGAYMVRATGIAPCGRADVAGLGGTRRGDGQITADDLVVFLGAFFASDLAIADIATLGGVAQPDGQLSADDLIAFLGAFFSGC
jgi:hypothetical protein